MKADHLAVFSLSRSGPYCRNELAGSELTLVGGGELTLVRGASSLVARSPSRTASLPSWEVASLLLTWGYDLISREVIPSSLFELVPAELT